jgi:hypothetical protein
MIKRKNDGITIKSGIIKSLYLNGNELVVPGSGESLWKMELRNRKTLETCCISATECKDWKRTEEIFRESEKITLKYVINDNKKDIISFKIQVILRDGKAEFNFFIKSIFADWQLSRVWCPVIPLERLPAGKTDGKLLIPHYCGQVIQDLHNEPERIVDYGNDALMAIARCRYPSKHATLQMAFYFGDAGGALFMTPDPQRKLKEFLFDRNPETNGVRASFLHYFNNPETGITDLSPGCPSVVEWVDGDWFDAAQVYRKWAEQQTWTEKTIPEREDIPNWLKTLPHWLRTPKDINVPWENFMDWPLKWAEATGKPMGVHVYGWDAPGGPVNTNYPKMGKPRAEFAEMVKCFHDSGIFVMPYTNTRVTCTDSPAWDDFNDTPVLDRKGNIASVESWGSNTTDQKEFNLAIKGGRKVKYENYAGLPAMMIFHNFAVSCAGAEKWQENIRENTMSLLIDEKVDAVYQDQLGSIPLICYDSRHGHYPGDPEAWQRGTEKTYREIRESMRRENIKGALISEYICEAQLPYIHGALTISPAMAFHSALPLFQAIYHPYFISLGWIEAKPASLKRDKHEYLRQLMQPFFYGNQLGWFFYTVEELIENHPDLVSCYRKMVDLRKKYPEMLCYGRLLRPPQTTGFKQDVFGAMFSDLSGKRMLAVFGNFTERTQSGKAALDISTEKGPAVIDLELPPCSVREFVFTKSGVKLTNLSGTATEKLRSSV